MWPRTAVAATPRRFALDAEHRMVGRDPRKLVGGRVVPDTAEELSDFPLPSAQVFAEDRLLLGVGDLDRRNG